MPIPSLQVLEGLVYLHEQGVIHRDIKGANILTTKEVMWLPSLGNDVAFFLFILLYYVAETNMARFISYNQGLVKLADFGVATKLTEADVNTHSVVGTPYWMAPEVLQ